MFARLRLASYIPAMGRVVAAGGVTEVTHTQEEVFEDDLPPPPPPKPKTLTVLLLLLFAAATFSYLGAYAATDMLARARIMRPLPLDHDLRPKICGIIFASILVVFLVISMVMRYFSERHFKRIDRMLEADRSAE